ncbi:monooxygenase [Coprinopsis sp. MPI-PUGE-AT-0042]|nr:monooxygenase [Coprinopsis sp. MPI-PUGE-AT-0042]
MNASLNVAIVGGGPGGLTLACILNQLTASSTNSSQLSFKVFELDASKEARSQGGMLDIHRSSGQHAIKRAGLIEEFKKHMRIEATELYIRDNAGVAHLHHSGEEHGGLGEKGREIDRKVLRSMLVDALPEESILWGKKLAFISKSSDNGANPKFNLHFADGTSANGFDIVVGADGTWSKVRTSVEALAESITETPSSIPPFSGVMCVEALISDAAKHYPHLVTYVGKGSCLSLSRTDGLISQMNGDGSLRTYHMFNATEDWTIKGQLVKKETPRTVPKGPFVKDYLSQWCDIAKELVLQSDTEDLLVRPLYEYPPGHSWTSPVSGITLLGDAAHVMTPFSGIGVNLALTDAMDLSVAIEEVLAGSTSITDAFKEYERKMYARSSANVVETFHNREAFLGKRTPGGTVLENEGIDKIVKRFTDRTYTQPTVEPISSKRSD